MRRIAWLLLVAAVGLLATARAQQFSDWGPRYNLGQPVNSEYTDTQPFISKDGLSLYFQRLECITCSSGAPQDIWVAHRETAVSDWQEPAKLPVWINGPSNEATPFVTIDGHFLLFASQRPGGYGKNDIYMSRRKDKDADFGARGWEPPINLGPAINTSFGERAPFVLEDESTGKMTLFFTSNRSGSDDIYTSELQGDGTWGPAVSVAELNTLSGELMGCLSRDGLDIYFVSNRPGSQVAYDGVQISEDIWMSHRASTSEPWSAPQPVTALNTPNWEGRPTLSWNGEQIYFNSVATPEECLKRGQCNISTAWDIWMASREKLTGRSK